MIAYRVVTDSAGVYLFCLPDGGMLVSEASAMDLVAACGEHQTDRVLIYQGNLRDAFFQLKTGLAGLCCSDLPYTTYAPRW
jgi:Domain of unknown function (DUF4180)